MSLYILAIGVAFQAVLIRLDLATTGTILALSALTAAAGLAALIIQDRSRE